MAKVYEITDSTALVDLMIHNFNDIETTIALRFERNDWNIDDFTSTKPLSYIYPINLTQEMVGK